MNNLIISEFIKLSDMIKHQLNINLIADDMIQIYKYKYNALKNIIGLLKLYPHKITLDNVDNLKHIAGIGKKTILRIKEILNNGYLKEVEQYNQSKNDLIINELETVIGIGNTIARTLVKQGITSIHDLKQKIKKKQIIVNEQIILGLKYHGKFFGNIPHYEITLIKHFINSIFNKLNKSLNIHEKYIFKICGSYRRLKKTSNDIDILVSKKKTNNISYLLNNIINELKKTNKQNNYNSFLIEDITHKNYNTKYMGFCKFKDNLIRRIDIRFVPWKSYYTALLYFTGSSSFNKMIRTIAHNKGYKLSEYELLDLSTNESVIIKSEKDIFKKLDIEYILPQNRN